MTFWGCQPGAAGGRWSLSENRTSAEQAKPRDRESLNPVTLFELLDLAISGAQTHAGWVSDMTKQKHSDCHTEAE